MYARTANYGSQDTFLEDITIAMMAIRPDPIVEARKEAMMRRAKTPPSRRRAAFKKVGRIIGTFCKSLPCPPWGRHD